MRAFPKYVSYKNLSSADKILVALLAKTELPVIFDDLGLYRFSGNLMRHAIRRKNFEQEAKRLQKRGYVALTKTPDGWIVKLLKKGKVKQRKALLRSLELKKPERWDSKWRLFIFDIPEKYRYERDFLRQKLKDLGLYNIQRSVFAYPYDCREELNLLSDLLHVAIYVTYAEVSYLDIDPELRTYFKIR